MSKATFASTCALSLAALVFCTPVLAQQNPGAGASASAPAGPPARSKNPAAAPAGVYKLDVAHSSVIARIAHDYGLSDSTIRFGVNNAVLNWNPAEAAAIKLEATVDTKPYTAPIIYNSAPDAPFYLNSIKFPTATFVSTAVVRTGDAKADVRGNLTLIGVTKPVVMQVEIKSIGSAARGRGGSMRIGFTGTMAFKRSEFGMSAMVAQGIGDDITLLLDGEFVKEGS